MSEPSAIGVIPARYGSTRFPAKILHPLAGRPLIQWVVERALQARRLSAVLVATDDERIARAVEGTGATAVMTRADHPSGTDRIAEAVAGRSEPVIINVQGDEPFMDPALIDRLAEVMAADPTLDMATAAVLIEREEELRDPSVVKVVTRHDGTALYFSRAPIPHFRDIPAAEAIQRGLHRRHLGVYAYRRDFLLRVIAQPPSPLEEAEKLEQLRALQMGCRMAVLESAPLGPGIDTPQDAIRAEPLLLALRKGSPS